MTMHIHGGHPELEFERPGDGSAKPEPDHISQALKLLLYSAYATMVVFTLTLI
jgi:hypothetical protein